MRSKDVKRILRANELDIAMHLFVRKNKLDKSFYYLGPINPRDPKYAKEIIMLSGKPAVELEYQLEVPVRDDIYDYIING